ncbi:MAG: hypothetical protein HYU66_08425 [Armatimonadetes bacterium]|nr:hypothetical protein [Armatimonadota bacterium]
MSAQPGIDPRLDQVEQEFAAVHQALRRLATLHGVTGSPGVLKMAYGLKLAGVLPPDAYDAVDHLRAAHDVMLGMEWYPPDVLSRFVESSRRVRRVLRQLMNAPVRG